MRTTWRGLIAALATFGLVAVACGETRSFDDFLAEHDVPASAFDEPGEPTRPSLPVDTDGDNDGTLPPSLDPNRTPCPFDGDAIGHPHTCGSVALDDAKSGASIAFAHFASSGGDTRPPVVFLHGGPGGSVLPALDVFFDTVVEPFLGERDVYVYDQRGGGASTALPPCWSAYDLESGFYGEPVGHNELLDAYVDRMAECSQGLEARGFDIRSLNSRAHAADLVFLLDAWDLDQVLLYADSYGTRLAQTLLRDHGDRVEAAIFTGTYPIEQDLTSSVPETFRLALTELFDACASIEPCGEALGDGFETLQAVVEALDEAPIEIPLPLTDGSSLDLAIDGTDLINALHGALYTWDQAAMVVDTLIDLRDGDTSRAERLVSANLVDIADVAGYASVQCSEEAPFSDAAGVASGRTGLAIDRIDDAPNLIGETLLAVCEVWASDQPDPEENEPVTWDQPTLLLAGAFDPITPAAWAEGVATRLPSATLALFPDRGHDAYDSDCAVSLMAAFAAAPGGQLDLSCVDIVDTPFLDGLATRWVDEIDVELSSESIPVTTFVDATTVTGLLPHDWVYVEDDDGLVAWRALDALDRTFIRVLDPTQPLASLLAAAEAMLTFERRVTEWEMRVAPFGNGTRLLHVLETPDLNLYLYRNSIGAPPVLIGGYPDEADALLAEFAEEVVVSFVAE